MEELSKGNQQKVQFIASILHDPHLIILDEPFSGLDPVNQILLKDVLMEFKQDGRAIIFSTHQMEQAEQLCDSICLIDKGHVVLEGELGEIKHRYGRNSIHLEFDGDGAFLSDSLYVRKALVYENMAELELHNNHVPGELLQDIFRKVRLRKFEVAEPSLNSIFLELVGPHDKGVEFV